LPGINCWGDDPGPVQLGNGDGGSLTPVSIAGLPPATAISTDAYDTCALLVGGGVDCWGNNADGELGNGGTSDSPTPVPVGGISTAIQITVGTNDACALLGDGSVECWGINEVGELADGSTAGPQVCGYFADSAPEGCSDTPVVIEGIGTATQIAGSGGYECAVIAGGSVDCWGDNAFGELGASPTGPEDCNGNPCSTTPLAVGDLTNAVAVSGYSQHSCALLETDEVACWGDDASGQLGDDNDYVQTGGVGYDAVPVRVALVG
jgi:alpha-tubulin suppressor-like RCC1 family protein